MKAAVRCLATRYGAVGACFLGGAHSTPESPRAHRPISFLPGLAGLLPARQTDIAGPRPRESLSIHPKRTTSALGSGPSIHLS